LDAQIITALTTLGIVVIGSLGTIVKVLVDKLTADLANNTSITKQARDASDGQLSSTIDKLAAANNTIVGLRAVVWDRDDQIAYLRSRLPQADELLSEYSNRRTRRSSDADVIAAEHHLLGN
jgi:hypothetical protein